MPDPQHRKRRRLAALRHAVLTKAPIRLTGGRLNRLRPGGNFRIHNRTIDLPRLPDALCGMTIAHFSDPHVGELITPAHLDPIIEATNALEADLIAVTGDFIDFSNRVLDDVIRAMCRLRAPLGVWFVLGNHDYLDDADAVKTAFADAKLNLLINQSHELEFRGQRLNIGGIDWSHKPADMKQAVRHTTRAMTGSDFSLLLAHHPHAFDEAHARGIDLTLSGHTHGGQLALTHGSDKRASITPARLMFRYTRGLYARGDSRLFVSTGVGSWFPLRFRCPAEISLLELQNPY